MFFKVRLVASGYAQAFAVDSDETYSPVTRITSLRTHFAVVAKLHLRISKNNNAKVTEEKYAHILQKDSRLHKI